MFKAGHTGFFDKGLDFVEVFISPVAAQTRRTAEPHASSLAGFRIDYVHLVANPAAGQERVAAHFDAFVAGIVHQFLEFGNVSL